MYRSFRRSARFSLVLLLVLALACVGCARKEQPGEPPGPPETAAQTQEAAEPGDFQEPSMADITYGNGFLQSGPEQVFPGPEILIPGEDQPLYLCAWTEEGTLEWAGVLSREAYISALGQTQWTILTKEVNPVGGNYLTVQSGSTLMTLPMGAGDGCISSPLGEFWFGQRSSLASLLTQECSTEEVPLTVHCTAAWSGDWSAAAKAALEAYADTLLDGESVYGSTLVRATVSNVGVLLEEGDRTFIQFSIEYQTQEPVDENQLAGNARILEDGTVAEDLVAKFVLDACGVCHLISLGSGI